ncbi:hypothetical protein [Actinokineospora sp. NBRC 105648]|uniref:hypothetical protein n=1 Tax=Actinokineospora sp. NBRC 105648 TaxID=3032206 RepID=UPI0024A39A90|nr:hypothetical protein [Actinokineospora sp. NBRC 105648]GLZ42887.1 hypothetical protein Acsp05_65110 [Actinokineospora sp. NBRC 105648]
MSQGVDIPVADLRRVLDLLLANAPQSVPLDRDYFWEVPPDARYDPTRTPVELTVGQLSESWAHLSDMLTDPDRVVGYGLVWAADVLRAMGHRG